MPATRSRSPGEAEPAVSSICGRLGCGRCWSRARVLDAAIRSLIIVRAKSSLASTLARWEIERLISTREVAKLCSMPRPVDDGDLQCQDAHHLPVGSWSTVTTPGAGARTLDQRGILDRGAGEVAPPAATKRERRKACASCASCSERRRAIKLRSAGYCAALDTSMLRQSAGSADIGWRRTAAGSLMPVGVQAAARSMIAAARTAPSHGQCLRGARSSLSRA